MIFAPTTFAQPMDMAAKDAKAADGGLKIFDKASKRGVFIQGLEEIAVKESTRTVTLLTKGNERRQITATKFNDHSSRSHSVFTITVHFKEKNNMGDDLMKVGKLNLVNGRVGKYRLFWSRKQEGEGSLVELVDKTQYVPYR
jgi:kinesin family protein 11